MEESWYYIAVQLRIKTVHGPTAQNWFKCIKGVFFILCFISYKNREPLKAENNSKKDNDEWKMLYTEKNIDGESEA